MSVVDLWQKKLRVTQRDRKLREILSCADALQYVIDKAGFCSEIHLLAKINRGGLL